MSGVPRTVSDIISTRLITPDGVRRAFCDRLCCDRWRLSNTSVVDAELAEGERRVIGSCVSCAWCGELIAVPADRVCRWHEPDDCPEFEPMASYHVQYAVRQLRELVGGPLSPRGFKYLSDHAHALRDCGRLDARDLVKFMRDVQLDWSETW
jgi:hypothetical protein